MAARSLVKKSLVTRVAVGICVTVGAMAIASQPAAAMTTVSSAVGNGVVATIPPSTAVLKGPISAKLTNLTVTCDDDTAQVYATSTVGKNKYTITILNVQGQYEAQVGQSQGNSVLRYWASFTPDATFADGVATIDTSIPNDKQGGRPLQVNATLVCATSETLWSPGGGSIGSLAHVNVTCNQAGNHVVATGVSYQGETFQTEFVKKNGKWTVTLTGPGVEWSSTTADPTYKHKEAIVQGELQPVSPSGNPPMVVDAFLWCGSSS